MRLLTPNEADLIYDLLVRTVGARDLDYLRWAFARSLVDLRVDEYLLDSALGLGARFHRAAPMRVSCQPALADVPRRRMVERANSALQSLAIGRALALAG